MIVIKENVDDEIFQEVILTKNEIRFLEKHGTLYGKVDINGDLVNFAIRIECCQNEV